MPAKSEGFFSLSPEQTTVIAQDFGSFYQKALEEYQAWDRALGLEKRELVFGEEGWRLVATSVGRVRLYENGLVWFGEEGSRWDGKLNGELIGTPADYLEIKDNDDKLKEYIATKLDIGRIDKSTAGHGGGPDELNPADYIKWLYIASENDNFRQNIERAVVELLGEEVGKDFSPFEKTAVEAQVEQALSMINDKDIDEEFYYLNRGGETISLTLSRLGLDDPESDEGIRTRDFVVEELEKTSRPMTLQEYLDSYGGSDKDKRESYKRDRESGNLHDVIHFTETPLSFKRALLEFTVRREIREALKEIVPQFNRLIGLLEIIEALGNPNNGFAETHSVLVDLATKGFHKDTPELEMGITGVNIYMRVLLALAQIQKDEQLREFWLNNIASDSHKRRVLASIHGVLAMHSEGTERRKEIPAILRALKERNYDIDRKHKIFAAGFYYEQTFLEGAIQHIGKVCFEDDVFPHLNQETGNLDFLLETKALPGKYTFEFNRYSPSGSSSATVTYDVETDKVSDGNFAESVNAAIDRQGFMLPNNVWLTSMNARRVTHSGDTKVVNLENQQLPENIFEGVISLNHVPFPFLYDADKQQILLGTPIEQTTRIFRGSDSWEERKANLDEVARKVSFSELLELHELGALIDTLAKQRKSEGYLGDTIYSLEGIVISQIEPYLLKLVETRLVRHPKDIVV